MLDPLRLHLLGRDHPIDRTSLAAVVDDIDPNARRGARLAFVLGLAVCLLAVGILAVDVVAEGPAAWADLKSTLMNPAIMVPNLAALIVACVIVPNSVRRARRARVRWALLRHERCPHCGYDLRGSPVDPADGATVCPECAAAWRLDEVDERPPSACGFSCGRRSSPILILVLSGFALLGVALLAFFAFRA
jgi:hypothetical protein